MGADCGGNPCKTRTLSGRFRLRPALSLLVAALRQLLHELDRFSPVPSRAFPVRMLAVRGPTNAATALPTATRQGSPQGEGHRLTSTFSEGDDRPRRAADLLGPRYAHPTATPVRCRGPTRSRRKAVLRALMRRGRIRSRRRSPSTASPRSRSSATGADARTSRWWTRGAGRRASEQRSGRLPHQPDRDLFDQDDCTGTMQVVIPGPNKANTTLNFAIVLVEFGSARLP